MNIILFIKSIFHLFSSFNFYLEFGQSKKNSDVFQIDWSILKLFNCIPKFLQGEIFSHVPNHLGPVLALFYPKIL